MANVSSNNIAPNSRAALIGVERGGGAYFEAAAQYLRGVLDACHSEEEKHLRMADFVKNPLSNAGGGNADKAVGLSKLTVDQRYAVADAVFMADRANSEL